VDAFRRPLIGALVVLLTGVAMAPLNASRAGVPADEQPRPVVRPERQHRPYMEYRDALVN